MPFPYLLQSTPRPGRAAEHTYTTGWQQSLAHTEEMLKRSLVLVVPTLAQCPSLSMHPGSVCLAGISGSRKERLSKGLCFTAEEEENRRCPAAGGQTMELGAQYRGLPWCKDVLHLYPIFSLKVPGVYHPPFSTLSVVSGAYTQGEIQKRTHGNTPTHNQDQKVLNLFRKNQSTTMAQCLLPCTEYDPPLRHRSVNCQRKQGVFR